MNKRKKKRGKGGTQAALLAVMAVCVLVLGISVWKLSGFYLEYKAGQDEYKELLAEMAVPETEDSDDETSGEEESTDDVGEEAEKVQRMELSRLKEKNEDTVGWIQIPATQISYPLMQRDDNSYYLNHTFSGKENSSGSIFVEKENSGDFSDMHTIIYGHNMKDGSMFAGLKEYRSPSYLVSHPFIYVELPDGIHMYQIFSVYEAEADSDSYTIGFAPDEQYGEFLKTLKGRSAYDTGVNVTQEDYVISLSTCTRNGENRYLVHAKKIS